MTYYTIVQENLNHKVKLTTVTNTWWYKMDAAGMKHIVDNRRNFKYREMNSQWQKHLVLPCIQLWAAETQNEESDQTKNCKQFVTIWGVKHYEGIK